jgi:hypothetical protein
MHGILKTDPPQNLTEHAYDAIQSYFLRENLDEQTRLTQNLLPKQP